MRVELSQAGLDIQERDFFKDPFSREEIYNLLGEKDPSEFFSLLKVNILSET